jgi:hypothetical protein
MKINEVITENQGETYFDAAGRVHFKTHDAYLKAKNSELGSMRKAALDYSKRNPPVGELWPNDWNASKPQQDQYASQITMPTDSQKPRTILDPNRAGLNIADISKPMQEPMQVARPEPPVAKPKPTMPMGGIAGVIRRKKQK